MIFEKATAEEVIRHILHIPPELFTVYPVTMKFKTYQIRS